MACSGTTFSCIDCCEVPPAAFQVNEWLQVHERVNRQSIMHVVNVKSNKPREPLPIRSSDESPKGVLNPRPTACHAVHSSAAWATHPTLYLVQLCHRLGGQPSGWGWVGWGAAATTPVPQSGLLARLFPLGTLALLALVLHALDRAAYASRLPLPVSCSTTTCLRAVPRPLPSPLAWAVAALARRVATR